MKLKTILLYFFFCNLPLSLFAQCNAENVKIPVSVAPHNKVEQPKTLIVVAKGVKDLKLTIFDRKGNKTFESNNSILGASNEEFKDIDTEWNGTVAGVEQEAGLYFYSVEAECLDKSVIRKSGTVVLTIDK